VNNGYGGLHKELSQNTKCPETFVTGCTVLNRVRATLKEFFMSVFLKI